MATKARMENVVDIVLPALQSGLASLASYLAAHVLLCLVPAFFVAGALCLVAALMVLMISRPKPAVAAA